MWFQHLAWNHVCMISYLHCLVFKEHCFLTGFVKSLSDFCKLSAWVSLFIITHSRQIVKHFLKIIFKKFFNTLLGKKKWWAGMDSNHRSLRRRIYSPFPLTTRAPTHKKMVTQEGLEPPTLWFVVKYSNPAELLSHVVVLCCFLRNGGPTRTRTWDRPVMSRLL